MLVMKYCINQYVILLMLITVLFTTGCGNNEDEPSTSIWDVRDPELVEHWRIAGGGNSYPEVSDYNFDKNGSFTYEGSRLQFEYLSERITPGSRYKKYQDLWRTYGDNLY